MIRLDRSASTVLAVCDCGWRALGNSDLEARAHGVDHETQCHPDRDQFRHAQWRLRRM